MKNMNPYLIFNGQCKDAMKFYEKCLGGVLYMSSYSDMPDEKDCADLPQEYKGWIMHARLTIKSLILMASDTRPGMPVSQGDNFFISLDCESIEEAERLFNVLRERGKVDMPLQETFFAVRFAMLTDQFGIKWMLNLEKK
jgi:PhnB protein